MICLLHISDLHLFNDPNWENMSAAIMRNVEETLKSVQITDRLLVVTGDFHQYSVAGYKHAKKFLKELIDIMDIEPANDVFLVPGNHDISMSAKKDLHRINAISSITHEHVNFDINRELLQSNKFYKEYLEFVKELGVYDENEVSLGLPIKTHVRTWRKRLNLLHLNTTLVADGASKKNQYTDTFVANSVVKKAPFSQGKCPSFCLGHNSFYDLKKEQRDQLAGAFGNGYISAYLSGDRHSLNRSREEKEIPLGGRFGSIRNIVCYRSSTDEKDDYSDFGMIWYFIDEIQWTAKVQFYRWDEEDQVELNLDGEDSFNIRHDASTSSRQAFSIHNTSKKIAVQNQHWLDKDRIIDCAKKELKPEHVKRFLLGRNSGRMYWNLIASNQIVRRRIVSTISDSANAPGIYVLLGAGGEGKTTALMQFGIELIGRGETVFFCSGYKPLPLPELDAIQEGSYFLLDNVIGYYSWLDLLEEMQKYVDNSDAIFVLAARENEWNIRENENQDYNTYFRSLVTKIPIGILSGEEAYQFAQCIKKNFRTTKDLRQIQKIFQDNSYGFLYASMLLAVHEKNTLDEIANDIINNIEHKSLEALLLLSFIVMSEHCEVETDRELLKKYFAENNLRERQMLLYLSKEIVNNAERFQTRHPVISKVFFQILIGYLTQDQLDHIIQELVLLRLELFNRLTGSLRWRYWKETKAVLELLSLTSSSSQEFILNRLLDETNSDTPKNFDTIFDILNNKATQSIYIRLCYDRDRLNSRILRQWTLKELLDQKWDYGTPYTPAWIYKRIFEKADGWRFVWSDWINFERNNNGDGNYEEENSAKWIYRTICLEREAANEVWKAWGLLEANNGNIGSCEQKYSARWIYRTACIEHKGNSEVWRAWGLLEANNGNIGSYEQEYSARWIYRTACIEYKGNSEVWRAWGLLEANNGNIGSYEQIYSARWIYRTACIEHKRNTKVWTEWGLLEANNGNIGSYEQKYSARWIYRTACIEYEGNSDIWKEWGLLEADNGNIGTYDEKNSARWIFRKACTELESSGDVWKEWGLLEAKIGNIGAYKQENSARWIFRTACIEHEGSSDVWKEWGQLEARIGNIGEYEQENSARWIFLNAINKKMNGENRLRTTLAIIELKEGKVENARLLLEMNYLNNVDHCGQLAIITIIFGSEKCSPHLEELLESLRNKQRTHMKSLHYLYYCYLLTGDTDLAERTLKELHNNSKYEAGMDQPMHNFINRFIALCQSRKEGKSITSLEQTIDVFQVVEETDD